MHLQSNNAIHHVHNSKGLWMLYGRKHKQYMELYFPHEGQTYFLTHQHHSQSQSHVIQHINTHMPILSPTLCTKVACQIPNLKLMPLLAYLISSTGQSRSGRIFLPAIET